jgi:hypothetical protein
MSKALALLRQVPEISGEGQAGPMLGLAAQLLAAGNSARANVKHADVILRAAVSIIETVRADLAASAPSARKPYQARTPRKQRANHSVADSSRGLRANPGSTGASNGGRGDDRALAVAAAPAIPPVRRPRGPRRLGGGRAEESDPEILDHNGVTATVGERSASIEHADRVIEVTPRQGRLVACLARAMPQPVDRKFIAGKVWEGARIPEAHETIISNLIAPIITPLAGMGLTLKTVRGVGLSLQKAGE